MKVSAAVCVLLSILGIGSCLECLVCSDPSRDCKEVSKFTCTEVEGTDSWCYSIASVSGLVQKFCHNAPVGATADQVCDDLQVAAGDTKLSSCSACKSDLCNEESVIAKLNTRATVKCHGCPAGDATCATPTEADCEGTETEPIPYCYTTLETVGTVRTLKKGCHKEATTGVSSEAVCAKLTTGLTDASCVACEGALCNKNVIPAAHKCLTCSVPTDKTCAGAPSTDCKPTLLKPFSYCYSVRGQDAGGADVVSRGCLTSATQLATDAAICAAVEEPKQAGCSPCKTADCNTNVPAPIPKCHGCPAGDPTCAVPTEAECAGTETEPFPYCYTTLETVGTVRTLKKGCHREATAGVSSEVVCAKLTGGLTDALCVACEGELCNKNVIPAAHKCLTCSVPTDKTCALFPSADCKPTLLKPHSYCYSVRGQDAGGADVVSRGCLTSATELATNAAICAAVEEPKQAGCSPCKTADCNTNVPTVPLECYKCADAGDTTCETEKESCTPLAGQKAVCYTDDVNVLEGGVTKHKVEKGCKSVAADKTKETYCEELKQGVEVVNKCHFCEEPLCNKIIPKETIQCKACAAGSTTCEVAADLACAGMDELPIPYCYSALGTVGNVKTLKKGCALAAKKGLSSEAICNTVTDTGMTNVECLACDRISCNVEIFPETIKCRECTIATDKACAATRTVECADATLAQPRANCFQATGTDEFLRRGCFYSPIGTTSSNDICTLVKEVYPGTGLPCTACRTERCNEPKKPSELKCYTCKNADDKDCKEEMSEDEFCIPEHDEESRCLTFDYNLSGDVEDDWRVNKGCVSVVSSATEETFCKDLETALGAVVEKVNKCTLCDEDYCNGDDTIPPVPLECYKCTDADDTTCEITEKESCTAADGQKAVCYTDDVNVLEGGVTKQKIEKGCKSVAADKTKETYCEELKQGVEVVNKCHFCEEPLCNKIIPIETIQCKACAEGSTTCSEVAADVPCAGTDDLPIPYCYSALGTVGTVKTLKKGCARAATKGLSSEAICATVTDTGMTNVECLACDKASCNVEIFPETIKCRECTIATDKACAATETVDCVDATLAQPRANCYQATGTDEFLRRGCFYSPIGTTSSNDICALVKEVYPGEACTACRTERCNEPKKPSELKCYTCKNTDDKDCKEEMSENEFCIPEHDEESRCSTFDYNLSGDVEDDWRVNKGCVSVVSSATEETYCKDLETALGAIVEKVNKCTLCDEDYCNGAATMAAGFLVTLVAVFTAIMY